ncbi:MAG: O-sialoglycoprotein endopeptidase, partial [Nitrososphaeria archaeon]
MVRRMIGLGIESTAHTFGASVISNEGHILSNLKDVYKPPQGSGIHPREASRHHSDVAPKILKGALKQAAVTYQDLDFIAYSAGPG